MCFMKASAPTHNTEERVLGMSALTGSLAIRDREDSSSHCKLLEGKTKKCGPVGDAPARGQQAQGLVEKRRNQKQLWGVLAPGSAGNAEVQKDKLGPSHREGNNVGNIEGLEHQARTGSVPDMAELHHGVLEQAGRQAEDSDEHL